MKSNQPTLRATSVRSRRTRSPTATAGHYGVVQMDVDAQQPTAVRPGTGKATAVSTNPTIGTRASRAMPMSSASCCWAQRRGDHETYRARRICDFAPKMSEVQVREIGMRAPGRCPHQQGPLVELIPEAVVDIERLDTRGAQCFVADHHGLAIQQRIAGARVPDLCRRLPAAVRRH